MGKLQGKVALVTGSGRNIGRATVLHLAREGAHVIVNARSNQAEADAVVREAVVAEAIGRGTPVIVGPSLNAPLLNHPEARASLKKLPAWGVTIVAPVDEGEGPRLAPSAVLVDAARPHVRRG